MNTWAHTVITRWPINSARSKDLSSLPGSTGSPFPSPTTSPLLEVQDHVPFKSNDLSPSEPNPSRGFSLDDCLGPSHLDGLCSVLESRGVQVVRHDESLVAVVPPLLRSGCVGSEPVLVDASSTGRV